MFGQDSSESLDGTENGSVDDDWSTETRLKGLLLPRVFLRVVLIGREYLRIKLLFDLLCLVGGNERLLLSSSLRLILQVEANGLLEINLDGTTLVWPVKCVIDLNINLRSIESTIAMVEGPWKSTAVQGNLKRVLCLVPQIVRSKSVLGTGRKLKLEREVKDGVDVLKEVEYVGDLTTDLILCAENVTIILLEASNSDQTAKGTRYFISMKHAKVSVAQGKVTIAVDAVLEHDAMTWAVH